MKASIFFLAGLLGFFSFTLAHPIHAEEVVSGDILQINNLVVVSTEATATSSQEGTLTAAVSNETSTPLACIRYETVEAEGGTTASCPPLGAGSAYRILIKKDTALLLKTRARAKLMDFGSGDRLNAFGFWSADGTIRAFVVRNLTKPKEKISTQLNGVQLVAVAHGRGTTELVVVQKKEQVCHEFVEGVDRRRSASCPPGLRSFADHPSSVNVKLPAPIEKESDTMRKYVVGVAQKTVVLNRLRHRLSLADFSVGDELNIYGTVNASGDVMQANIVRNVTKPTAAARQTSYRGTITQLNLDGSLILKTDDGEKLTIPSPIGGTVSVRGVLDETAKVLRQISELVIMPSALSDTALMRITTTSRLEASLENEYYGVFQATGGTPDYIFLVTAGSLPPGMYLASPPTPEAYCPPSAGACTRVKQTSVLLRGAPTNTGTYEFTLTARDQYGNTGSETFKITVLEPLSTGR